MKYKVGDKVKIREDLDTDEMYDGWDCSEEMLQYGGKIATIVKCCDDSYKINVGDNFYNWTDEMFEDVEIIQSMSNACVLMTVEDLLNKTDVEKSGLIITIYYPNVDFEATIGHNRINRNSELYKRFIKAYGDMIVDEVSFDIKNENMVAMLIKVDYAD